MGMELVHLVLIVERDLHISLDHNRFYSCRTIGDLVQLLAMAVREQRRGAVPSDEEIESYLRTCMIREFAIKPEEFHRDAELIRDLGLG